MSVLIVIVELIVAYLMGSVCSAVIVSQLFGLPDPRSSGSKNPGATNVLRLSGKKYAAIVLLADMLKGTIPVVFAGLLGANNNTMGYVCLAAVLGHMYPLFFHFKGGKGVATALGGLLGLHFILGAAVLATWIIVFNLLRYSSLASLLAIVLSPIYSLIVFRSPVVIVPLTFLTLLVVYQHRNNISRLTDGTEPKVSKSTKKR